MFSVEVSGPETGFGLRLNFRTLSRLGPGPRSLVHFGRGSQLEPPTEKGREGTRVLIDSVGCDLYSTSVPGTCRPGVRSRGGRPLFGLEPVP